MKGLVVFFLVVSLVIATADDNEDPNTDNSEGPVADSEGSGKVETGDTDIADVKLLTKALGKYVKSSDMEAMASKDRAGTLGEAKTEVKNEDDD